MKYYKMEQNSKLIMIGTTEVVPQSFEADGVMNEITELTEAEYNELLLAIQEHAAKVQEYIEKVQNEELTLEEVPEDVYEEVEQVINYVEPEPVEEPTEYELGYEQALADLIEMGVL